MSRDFKNSPRAHDDEWRQVRVTFRKAVSDGNYGTESAEVTLEDWAEEPMTDADYKMFAAEVLQEARALVHAELERSPSQRVRLAVVPGVHGSRLTGPLVGPDDDGEE